MISQENFLVRNLSCDDVIAAAITTRRGLSKALSRKLTNLISDQNGRVFKTSFIFILSRFWTAPAVMFVFYSVQGQQF